MNNITIVTGLWDIKRSDLGEGWNRSFEDHYVSKFRGLLDLPYNLIVFGDEELEQVVWEKRDHENTLFVHRPQEWFKNEFYDKIQEIRQDDRWYNQAGWLPESTQAKLEMYNPLVMSKMFLLNDASVLDKFDSTHLYWLDAGISNTVNLGYFTHDKVMDKLPSYSDKFHFLCFPYDASNEIHGFRYPDINNFADADVKMVARGGFFGGPKETISEANNIYYSLLKDTLDYDLMGTEESVFSIMVYKHNDLFTYSLIESNGLIYKFFEDLKNDTLKVLTHKKAYQKPLDFESVALYVLTFNSPSQFEKLCLSFEQYDKDFLDLPKKYLLNNSTDRDTDEDYRILCEKYGFEEIKKDNLGICGGRQFIAEHFEETGLEYSMFFEDDMFFYTGEKSVCRNGFNRFIPNLYRKALGISDTEKFDFLKLNFSEFFGDNTVQWAWYNVPMNFRSEKWPDNDKLPRHGFSKNAPLVNYNNIKSYKGVPYVTGEIYYCNWPQIVSKEGNKKMFLNTTWAHPFEQTWMSHIFQLTINNELKPGLLLATPTEHDRFDHYDGKLRKES